jgi:hypothetical protein
MMELKIKKDNKKKVKKPKRIKKFTIKDKIEKNKTPIKKVVKKLLLHDKNNNPYYINLNTKLV